MTAVEAREMARRTEYPTRGSGVRYGALAVESGGAGPKEGPLEV